MPTDFMHLTQTNNVTRNIREISEKQDFKKKDGS